MYLSELSFIFGLLKIQILIPVIIFEEETMFRVKVFLSVFYASLFLAANYFDWTFALPGNHDDDYDYGVEPMLMFGAVAGMLGQ